MRCAKRFTAEWLSRKRCVEPKEAGSISREIEPASGNNCQCGRGRMKFGSTTAAFD
jgi:hypothetical protein